MEMIYKSALDLVGGTPLVEVGRIAEKEQLAARLLVKLEYLNPAGSVKDRTGKAMIEEAEAAGSIAPGATIIEPTSGNTGIGLAVAAAIKGYKLILTMPDTMSVERINILKAYGAEIVLTPGAEGMTAAIQKAKELADQIPGSVIMGQFDNPANPQVHRDTTGPEIWKDTDGAVDMFVATVGTGGTLTGTGEYLKAQKPGLKVVAVEPAESPLLSGGQAGPHGIQGIGANFIPSILNTQLYDEVICVTDADAYATSKMLTRTEGILTGISSGAALWAGLQLAKREENAGKTIVVLLPDSGDRYYSTLLFG